MTDWDELRLRAYAAQLRMIAGQATVAAAAADLALTVHRFAKAWREAEQRDIDAVLFEHEDLVALDMADAYWRPE